jgi:hypothetical protein
MLLEAERARLMHIAQLAEAQVAAGIQSKDDASPPEPCLKRKVLDEVKTWLISCNGCHKMCNERKDLFRGCFPRVAPRLILLASGGRAKTARLVDNLDSTSSLPPYTALSYCWGDDPSSERNLILSRNTYRLLKEGIAWDDMPRTFRDAFAVSYAFGIHYVWIEALCVVEDVFQDWSDQARQIGAVFCNAELTIAATASTSIDSGLVFASKRSHVKSSMDESGPASSCTNRYLMQREMIHQPLDRRAWALQERIFSTRLLEFDSGEVRWRCCGHAFSDNPHRDRVVKLPAIETLLEAGVWSVFLDAFTQREVRHAYQKRYAMAAAAKAFARLHDRLDSDYLAGHWRRTLASDLLWITTLPVPGVRPDTGDAPTWSWLSIPGRGPSQLQFVNPSWVWESRLSRPRLARQLWTRGHKPNGPHFQPRFIIESTDVCPANGNAYTDFTRRSHLRVQCPILPLVLNVLEPETGLATCNVDESEFDGVFQRDYAIAHAHLSPRVLFFIPLVLYLSPWPYGLNCICVDGLVLTRRDGPPENAFKRIGVMRIKTLSSVPSLWTLGGYKAKRYIRSIRLY